MWTFCSGWRRECPYLKKIYHCILFLMLYKECCTQRLILTIITLFYSFCFLNSCCDVWTLRLWYLHKYMNIINNTAELVIINSRINASLLRDCTKQVWWRITEAEERNSYARCFMTSVVLLIGRGVGSAKGDATLAATSGETWVWWTRATPPAFVHCTFSLK